MKYSNYTKKQLIKVIETLEHNTTVLAETIHIQFKNYKKIIDELEVKNGY